MRFPSRRSRPVATLGMALTALMALMAVLSVCNLGSAPTWASSHREAPIISQDPVAVGAYRSDAAGGRLLRQPVPLVGEPARNLGGVDLLGQQGAEAGAALLGRAGVEPGAEQVVAGVVGEDVSAPERVGDEA